MENITHVIFEILVSINSKVMDASESVDLCLYKKDKHIHTVISTLLDNSSVNT